MWNNLANRSAFTLGLSRHGPEQHRDRWKFGIEVPVNHKSKMPCGPRVQLGLSLNEHSVLALEGEERVEVHFKLASNSSLSKGLNVGQTGQRVSTLMYSITM